MAFLKKYIVAVLVMAVLSSCSKLIRDFGMEHRYRQKNKGKEGYLVLEVSLRDDTIFANGSACLEMTANLKYFGDDYYYFHIPPSVWRMDGGVAMPNAFLRTFYYCNEKCRVMEDFVMHSEGYKYHNYLLRPGKCMTFIHGLDVNRLLPPDVKLPLDADYMETARNWRNTDYGEYQMELCYITEFQDTIRSNKVTFWYLEE